MRLARITCFFPQLCNLKACNKNNSEDGEGLQLRLNAYRTLHMYIYIYMSIHVYTHMYIKVSTCVDIYIYIYVKRANMRICKLQRHRFRASSGGTMAESIRKHAWCEPQCAMYDQKQHQQKEEETS